MAIVDGDVLARLHIELEKRTKAVHRQLAGAARLADEKAARAAKQRVADALAARCHLHARRGRHIGAVAEQILARADFQHLHPARHGGRQQAVTRAARGFDALLKERLAIGKAAHGSLQNAALHGA